MKKIVFLLLLNLNSLAQKSIYSNLINYWVKNDITAGDGSKIYDAAMLKTNVNFKFISKDSVYLMRDGKLSKYGYALYDSTLQINSVKYQIINLSDISLKLKYVPDGSTSDSDGIIFSFTPKNLDDLTFTPDTYKSKNGETVYENIPGKIEPLFVDKRQSCMDFIAEKFAFPEYKKGGFMVRFVITSKGELKGARVTASSNDRYNDKLVAAVQATAGKWMPAAYMGKNVTTEVQYDFNLGYTDDSNKVLPTDSLKFSDLYYGYGNDFFEEKSYRQAETYYTKAINYNPLNIHAYYQRAACNIFLRKKDEACADYKQLILLDQQKAKSIAEKYCN